MGLQPGELIDDKYRIVRLIGEGGMGAVYEGENTRIHRRVAIKVLHAGVCEMPDVVARFEREAQAAGRIGSEHIVEVLDLGTLQSGDRYMVMEFMDGDSLSQRIRQRGSMQPADLYPVARQLLDALTAAHNAGIVHRDLKPDNVFLLRSRRGQADFVKLLDFGISKFSSGPGGLSMTRTGAVMGTPYYMAPEQAKGAKDIDHRVDVYAAGVILYEALAGRVPFLADTFNELLFKIVLEKPEPLAQIAPHVDPVLAGIVETAMAREPKERFQTAEALRDALDHWAAQQGHHAPTAPVVAKLPVPQPMPVTGGSSMLGSTPGNWAGASAVGGVAPPPPQSRVGLIAAAAAAVVVLGIGGAVLLTRGSHEPVAAPTASEPAAPTTAAAPTVPAPPPPAAVASAEPPAPTVAVAPASPPAPSSASTAATAAPAPAKVAHRPVASPSRPATASPAKPAPKPEPPPSQPTTGRKIRQNL
jgi:serine/threonine-protein kinase